MIPALTILGTDTDVGKTFVTGALAAILRESGIDCGVSKPVQSGAASADAPESDASRLRLVSGVQDSIDLICPYSFPDPLAPPVAAALAGATITLENLHLAAEHIIQKHELSLIETAGGLLSPTAANGTVADFANQLRFQDNDTPAPALLIARAGLGTVNHTLLTIETAKKRGLTIRGIILNRASNQLAEATNPGLISEYTDIPILGMIPEIPQTATRDEIINTVSTAIGGIDKLKAIIDT